MSDFCVFFKKGLIGLIERPGLVFFGPDPISPHTRGVKKRVLGVRRSVGGVINVRFSQKFAILRYGSAFRGHIRPWLRELVPNIIMGNP